MLKAESDTSKESDQKWDSGFHPSVIVRTAVDSGDGHNLENNNSSSGEGCKE